MPKDVKILTNPTEALIVVGKENTELHEEVTLLQAYNDLYRNALTSIMKLGGPAGSIATAALGKHLQKP